jgi:phytoene dehydrogenase-like protein
MGGGPIATMTDTSPRIIVIGAGVAGLACAADLVKAGHSVRVLEARNRIGGRTHTDTTSLNGVPMDLGGRYVTSA